VLAALFVAHPWSMASTTSDDKEVMSVTREQIRLTTLTSAAG